MSALPSNSPASYQQMKPSERGNRRIGGCRSWLLFMVCWLSFLQTAQAVCYNNRNGNCMLCLSDDGSSVSSCNSSQGNGDNCRSLCCGLSYAATIPGGCYNNWSTNSGSSVSVSTIVVIVVFSIPVVICVILLVHACIVSINRTPAQPSRVSRREERQSASAINLQNYNIEESFPYCIDSQQTCSICLENACHLMTFCGHTYHAPCLRAWIKKKETCPLCVSAGYNPIGIFCIDCGRSIKLGAMFSRMSSAKKAEWEESTTSKCSNCLNQQQSQEIEISLGEEEIERYQKGPDKKEIFVAGSLQRVIPDSNPSSDFH